MTNAERLVCAIDAEKNVAAKELLEKTLKEKVARRIRETLKEAEK